MLHACLPWQWAERDSSYYARIVNLLGCKSWYNWQYRDIGMEKYVPMVYAPRLGPQFTKAIETAQRRPRQLFLMGNECERPEQADVSPAEFVAALWTWVALVGGRADRRNGAE